MEQEARQMNLTLYTAIGDFSRVAQALKEQYRPVTKEVLREGGEEPGQEQLVLRLQDDSQILFTINHSPEFLEGHLEGMLQFFQHAPCENATLKEGVLRQISVFNCVVGCVFSLTDNEDRTNHLAEAFLHAAGTLNGLVLLPSMQLLDRQGRLVFSIEGESDLDSYTPVGNSDLLDGTQPEAPEDVERRNRSIRELERRGIPYLSHLRPAVPQGKARIRPAEEIARRLVAMFTVCVYCEACKVESRTVALEYVAKMDKLLGGRLDSLLTPEEQAFLQGEEPTPQDLANFGWRYECCHVLMWALRFVETLGHPDHICDLEPMAKLFWNIQSLENLVARAKRRGPQELLDAADLILRYRWACVDARLHGKELPGGLNGEVLYEWHYAFNWLIGANNGADWDQIAPHT